MSSPTDNKQHGHSEPTNTASGNSHSNGEACHGHGHGHGHDETQKNNHLHGKDCGHLVIAHQTNDGASHLGFVGDDGSVSCYVAPENVKLEDLCFDGAESCDCPASSSPHLHAKLAVDTCIDGECAADCETNVLLPLLHLDEASADTKTVPCSPSRWGPIGKGKKKLNSAVV